MVVCKKNYERAKPIMLKLTQLNPIIEELAKRVSQESRCSKLKLLAPLIREAKSILDVGSGRKGFMYSHLPENWSGRIVAIDKRRSYLDDLKRLFPFVETYAYDAAAMPFQDSEFDLVISNAMLEHVPDIASDVAREIRRVGRHYFVAVPYRFAIVESHYRLPFIGFLQPACRDWLIINVLRRSELHNDPIKLLTRRDMGILFPNARILQIYAAFGLFSSIVAVH